MYLYTQLPDQVLVDFAREQNTEVVFAEGVFESPLFSGLDRPGVDGLWNHRLWAIEDRFWESFKAHICSSVLVQRSPKKVIWCPTFQSITILDPVFRQRGVLLAEVPAMEIGVFGLVSAKRQLYLNAHSTDLFQLPVSCWTHGTPELSELQQALFDKRKDLQHTAETLHHSGDADD